MTASDFVLRMPPFQTTYITWFRR